MLKLVLGFDGSRPASTAIDTATELFPKAHATLAHFWSSPIADSEAPGRFTARARSLDELIEIAEREGAERADRLVSGAVAEARAAGWDAEPLVRRMHGGVGFGLAQAAEELEADLIVLGARGLGGVKAVLGSTSDLVAHVSTVPVLVVPQRTVDGEGDAPGSGPVLVGYDGSEGSRTALTAAASLFAGREFIIATVDDGEADPVRRDALSSEGIGDAEVIVLEPDGRGTRGVGTALSRCADERGASAVVVGSRGRSAAREILLGSAAMAVLHEADRPVLMVPGRRFG
jgi:nucleotide-binding universal stress UspA family protein